MSARSWAFARLLAVSVAAQALATAPAAGQPAKGAGTPRTPWGAPDLQGIWTSDDARSVPMQRPPQFAGRDLLTDAEFAERTKRDDETRSDTRNAAGTFVGEVGSRTFRQTSLVVDPPDGRIPPATPQAQQRAAATAAARAAPRVQPTTWPQGSDGRPTTAPT